MALHSCATSPASPAARPARFSAAGLLIAVLVAAAPLAAQESGRIVGTVTDAQSGAPVGEAQVFVPGTGLGGLSRANGTYLILGVPAGQHNVRAERIGMSPVTQQVTVAAGQTAQANFQMTTQALGLDEIVVTGTAGAARRREVGSSINQINTAALPERQVQTTALLQASAPGIEVTGGGSAGQGSKIRLRGVNSVNMNSDPIIYVDGVRIMSGAFAQVGSKDAPQRGANVTTSPLDMINAADIERVEIIKGSAATTLYGTEASAGVIQVFTRRGSQGAPVWTLESQQGTMWSQRFGYGDIKNKYGDSSRFLYMEPWICTGFLKCGSDSPASFDYQPLAWTQVYSSSVRGGAQALQYFSSAEYMAEHGNTPNDDQDRWSVRGNFTYSPSSMLQFQWNTAYVNLAQSNSPQGNNAEGLELNVFRQNQNYFADANPELIQKMLSQSIKASTERFTTGGTGTFSPISDLTNRFTVGYDLSNKENRLIRPVGFPSWPTGTVLNSTFQKRVLTFDYVGTYAFGILENVRSSFSWGGQAIGDEDRWVEGYGLNFPGAAAPTVSSASTVQGYERRSKVWNAGFFFQNVFDVGNKYFVTVGMRVDGNSAFGTGFGLQLYPKVSGSWVASDESFWRPSWGTMKVRAAYGRSGRAPGAFDAVRTWSNQPLKGQVAFVPENLGNANLGPEVTGEFETGFDAAWLDDRIRATYTFYRQLTEDALLNVQQPPSLGFTNNQLENIGEIRNTGMEIGLDGSVLRGADWGWDLGVNVGLNESEVLSNPTRPQDVGRPVRYTLQVLVRNPDAIPAVRGQVPNCTATTAAGVPCLERDVFRGPDLPTKNVNLNTTVRMPFGVSLSARGEYRGGHFFNLNLPIAIPRSVRSPLCMPYYVDQETVTLRPDTPALWQARCTPTINQGYSIKADYFKLRSLTLTAPMNLLFPERIQNATLTLTLGNFWTWSEESPWGTYAFENFGNAGVNQESASLGISGNERIPPPTTLRASLRVTF
jgi:outer membrane receptor protein involved in Fe transport